MSLASRPAITAAVPMAGRALQREILNFWFDNDLTSPKWNPDLWCAGLPAVDQLITEKYKHHAEAAARGEYGNWMQDAHGSLALVLLLDQFPLNIYRDQPLGYDTATLAIPVSYTMIGRGFDLGLPDNMRMFCYVPLMHSEKLVDQDECVEAFQRTGLDPEYAIIHRDVIAKYGRFPGRNKVHGRTNTPEEEEYLKDGGVY